MSAYIYELVPGFAASCAALIIGTKLSGGADVETVKIYEMYTAKIKENKRQG